MISIIIPAYNSENTIIPCLKSLTKQDYSGKYEIILVDDGSTDKTSSKAKTIKGVTVLKQKNAGPAKARNTGVRASKGDIIMFTDSDCIADRSFITEMAAPLRNKKIAGVQGKYKTRQQGMIPEFIQAEIEERYEMLGKTKYIDFIGTYAAAYKRKEYLSVGGFDESFPTASGEDVDLSFRIADAGHKMVFAPKAIIYHTHPDKIKKYIRMRYLRGYWGRLLYKKHPDRKGKGSYRSEGFYLGIILTCLMSILTLVFIPFDIFISQITFAILIGTILFQSSHYMIKDRSLVLASPVLVFLRNISIGLGIVLGMIKIR